MIFKPLGQERSWKILGRIVKILKDPTDSFKTRVFDDLN